MPQIAMANQIPGSDSPWGRLRGSSDIIEVSFRQRHCSPNTHSRLEDGLGFVFFFWSFQGTKVWRGNGRFSKFGMLLVQRVRDWNDLVSSSYSLTHRLSGGSLATARYSYQTPALVTIPLLSGTVPLRRIGQKIGGQYEQEGQNEY